MANKHEKLINTAIVAVVTAVILLFAGLEVEKSRSKTVDATTAENREMLKMLFERDREELKEYYKQQTKLGVLEERIKCLHAKKGNHD